MCRAARPRWVAWLARGLLVTVGGVLCWFLLNGVASAAPAERDGPATPEQASRTADRVVDSATPSDTTPKPLSTGVDAVDQAVSAVTRQADDAAQQIDDTVDEVHDVDRPDTAVDRGHVLRSDNTQPTSHPAESSRTSDRSSHTTTSDAHDVAPIASHRTADAGAQPVELPVPEQETVATTALAIPTATTSDAALFTLPSYAAPPTWQAEFARSSSGKPPVSPD